MSEVKPLSPTEIAANRINSIPPEVIETVNELLTEKFVPRCTSVVLLQDEIIARATTKLLEGKTARLGAIDELREKFFKHGWLNFESLFEDVGWRVTYDKPAYNETYDANFKFTPADKVPYGG
jgi:hypothetical protein